MTSRSKTCDRKHTSPTYVVIAFRNVFIVEGVYLGVVERAREAAAVYSNGDSMSGRAFSAEEIVRRPLEEGLWVEDRANCIQAG